MDIVGFLSRFDMFAKLNPKTLKLAFSNAKMERFSDSNIIIKKGDRINYIGVIMQGRVNFSHKLHDGSVNIVSTIKKGGIFGELSMVRGELAAYDFVAEGDCVIIKISREDLAHALVEDRELVHKMAATINIRLRMDTFLNAQESMADPYDLNFTSVTEPVKVLVVNAGSSSLKYSLFDIPKKGALVEGLIEKIGSDEAIHKIKTLSGSYEEAVKVKNIKEAFYSLESILTNPKTGCIHLFDEIKITAHRVVHGGNNFSSSVVINPAVIEAIKECIPLAPLHNPHNLAGIEMMVKRLPNAVHVAAFDTAYHQSMPEKAFLYGLPVNLYKTKQIRRYGFHGTNHNFVCLQAASFLKKSFGELKLISCHLGNGTSICATEKGRCVDTSMGMTPLAGLIMGTRCGDIDPGIIPYLMETNGYTAAEVDRILNKESGLKGLSGFSNDMREIIESAENGNMDAEMAITIFCYRVKKYIGAYIAALGYIDALIFTGGIGEHSQEIRGRICQGLDTFGITIDDGLNKTTRARRGEPQNIAAVNEKTAILVIAADEERMIAREALHAIKRKGTPSLQAVYKKTAIPVTIMPLLVTFTEEDFKILFGAHRHLTLRQPILHTEYFLCEETVNIVGPAGTVKHVHIAGPFTAVSQFVLTKDHEFTLGIEAPTREFLDVSDAPGITPGITVEGLTGSRHFERGLMLMKRHIVMSPEYALMLSLKDRDVVRVRFSATNQDLNGVLIKVVVGAQIRMLINDYDGSLYGINGSSVAYIQNIEYRMYN
ncbi:MAG: acetate/propionate family kinase [Candidatus Magnetoovum sp. WYHC-5]|nr:acetate/propionate family kinase [Candidatus Magnetoovum sp. WYHC-5]